MRPLLALLVLCACGDNAIPIGDPIAASSDVVIVAHEDDDLYFMQPDLVEAIQSGKSVTSIYVTAGNDNFGPKESDIRYAGLRYAYGHAAGSTDWHCGYIDVAGHTAQHCRLRHNPVSLVFLGYPDGGIDGEFPHSLLKLWEGVIPNAVTIAHHNTVYTQDGLIEVVAELLRETQPETVHTLEVASTHGHDHTDHMIVGALSLLAMARAQSQADVIAYRGYSMLAEPANKDGKILDETIGMIAYYDACSAKCAKCGSICTTISPAHEQWYERRYAVGFRRAASGKLEAETGCIGADLALGDCAAAPSWRIEQGSLRRGDQCAQVSATGEVTLAACSSDPAQRVFLDDEGHLWSAVTPTPQDGMDYAHLWCLAPTATGIHAQLCGRDPGAPTWTFAPTIVLTPRSLVATGREVRLGDLDGDGFADLCAVQADTLVCASGDGAGSFSAATPRSPLAIAPETLTFGDVDGDGRIDACGRTADGVVCALAATGFAPMPWCSALKTGGSFASFGANVCGSDTNGIECGSRGATSTLSSWPDPAAPAWLADFDGDGKPDWCVATANGPACGVAAEAPTTTAGASWAFSLGGVADSPTLTAATTGAADVDGDGRAELCSLDGAKITCARSQGRGFGPRITIAQLPGTPTALWLGDLDGDGMVDACADLGGDVACAISPP